MTKRPLYDCTCYVVKRFHNNNTFFMFSSLSHALAEVDQVKSKELPLIWPHLKM